MEHWTSKFFARPFARLVSEFLALNNRLNGHSEITLREVRSLLCVELTRLGDVVSMLPAIRVMKEALPSAAVHVAVDHRSARLFRFAPWVDKVIPCHGTVHVRSLLRTLRGIRGIEYDLVCSMSPSYRNAILASGVHARARVGYFSSSDSLTPFLHSTRVEGMGIRPFTPGQYEKANLYQRSQTICDSLGLNYHVREPELTISDSDLIELRSRLANRGLSLERPYVVLHPFAGWKYRQWKRESVIEFLEVLTSNNIPVVIIGEEGERTEAERFLEGAKRSESVQLAMGLPLDEAIILINSAVVFVGTDSGPLHLATALKVPVIGLYGPAEPRYTAPLVERNSYLFHRVECCPCEQRICVRPDRPCMSLITAEEVLERLRAIHPTGVAAA